MRWAPCRIAAKEEEDGSKWSLFLQRLPTFRRILTITGSDRIFKAFCPPVLGRWWMCHTDDLYTRPHANIQNCAFVCLEQWLSLRKPRLPICPPVSAPDPSWLGTGKHHVPLTEMTWKMYGPSAVLSTTAVMGRKPRWPKQTCAQTMSHQTKTTYWEEKCL